MPPHVRNNRYHMGKETWSTKKRSQKDCEYLIALPQSQICEVYV